jgi:pyruvate-formate lyase-activating enzyme
VLKVKIDPIFHESWLDYPDNESLATLVYIYGCTHNCNGCHSQNLQYILKTEGLSINLDSFINEILIYTRSLKSNKLVLSGGDWLTSYNIIFTKEFVKKTSNMLDICIYTGYDIGYVKKRGIKGFKFIKCGKYDVDKKQIPDKTDTYMTFASTNQILYNSKREPLSVNGKFTF